MDLRVVVVGAGGKMGREVVKAVPRRLTWNWSERSTRVSPAPARAFWPALVRWGSRPRRGWRKPSGRHGRPRSSTSAARYRLRQRARCGGEGRARLWAPPASGGTSGTTSTSLLASGVSA